MMSVAMSLSSFLRFCMVTLPNRVPLELTSTEHNSSLRRVWNFRHQLQNFLLKKLWEVRSPAHKLGILAGRGEGRRHCVRIFDLPEIDNGIQASDCVFVGSDQLPSSL